ncbi:MAG: single-stranded DNA-binding protein [Chlamydiae bacterium]|nr:single-stranded DNA-binding protein [Chlamydiota bacterium]
MNHITVAGHLGEDPKVRFTSSGQKVTTFSLATRARGGKDKEDKTIWWRITVWGEQFDKMIRYLKKGSPVLVVGELNKPEIFTDREGKPQVSMNITAANLYFSPFGRPSDGGNQNQEAAQPAEQMAHAAHGNSTGGMKEFGQSKVEEEVFNDDEIPF